MGFYLGSRGLHRSSEELTPVVTPGEFVNSLSVAIRAIMTDGQCRGKTYGQAVRSLRQARPGVAVRALSRILSAAPRDPVVHRMLAVAQFDACNVEEAARHLGISLALARHDATTAPSLGHSLRAHLDGALARLVLIPIHVGRGQRDAAQALAREGLIML